jgi:small subunit ribosomal protein S7
MCATSLLRFNSSEAAAGEQVKTTQDEDAESWLAAVRELRSRYQSEGVPDFDAPHMQQLSQEKFEPTAEQLAKYESLKDKPVPGKTDSVVQHCTNMIMKDGKKAKAQRLMARALYIVKLQLRQDPVEVLKETLDKMGPLMQLKTYKTRVAKNLTVPAPLNARQRNRRAFQWIIEGSEKRRSKDFAVRLGEEIISAYEGKSSGYEKRLQMHKAAMLHRAYIKLK